MQHGSAGRENALFLFVSTKIKLQDNYKPHEEIDGTQNEWIHSGEVRLDCEHNRKRLVKRTMYKDTDMNTNWRGHIFFSGLSSALVRISSTYSWMAITNNLVNRDQGLEGLNLIAKHGLGTESLPD